MMLLSPKWTTFAFEWGELKATVAALEKKNADLSAKNDMYAQQIQQVNAIATSNYASAEDLVQSIAKTRHTVDWAAFLPNGSKSYGVALSPKSELFQETLSGILGPDYKTVSKAFEDNNWTVVKPASTEDLKESPPDALWITPSAAESSSTDGKAIEDRLSPRGDVAPLK